MSKSPLLAEALSFIIGGLGQAYLGLWGKAIVFFTMEAVTGYLYFANETETLFILNLLIGALSMADAYYSAKHMKPKEKKEQIRTEPQVKVF